MRVLFVIPGEAGGTSMIFAKRQAAGMLRQGVETEAFYLRSRTSPWVLAAEWRRFGRVLTARRPDVVHAHFGTVTALFCALTARRPLVVTYRGSDLNPSPAALWPRAAIGRLLSQAAALGADHIVCVSRQLRDRLWWRRERVTVIPSGVDAAMFFPQPRSLARRALGWPDEDRVVLFNAGHNPKGKRRDLAEAAFGVLAADFPRARMEVLDGHVEPARIPTTMNASDCLLMTSDWEGSPTVVQEALACDLPIVSVDVGDIRERLDGVANVRVVARDPRALGRALAALVARPLRSDGHRKLPEFSAHEITRRLRAIYEQVAQEDEG